MTLKIPESHFDLVDEPINAVLTTMMADKVPHSSMVWLDYDGEHLLVNTALERQKTRNMQRNSKVTVLVMDPEDTSRWMEVRGCVADICTTGAENHADRLTRIYTGKSRFYGDVYSIEQKQQETRVMVRIKPTRITLDAIFR